MTSKNTAILLACAAAIVATFTDTPSARAELAQQVSGWEVSSSSSTHTNAQTVLTDTGAAMLLHKNKTTGISSIVHFGADGNPHPSYPSPIALSLPAYPGLVVNEYGYPLIPLGGNPAAFLWQCKVVPNNGAAKIGYCKVVFGQGLSQTFGASGFMENPKAAGNSYLGEVGEKIYTTWCVFDRNGTPDYTYGTLGVTDSLPTGVYGVDEVFLQPSGSVLVFCNKSSSAPDAYNRYLFRYTPEGHLDSRFSNGILVGSISASGLSAICAPIEVGGQLFYHILHTTGKFERFTVNPTTGVSSKVGEVNGLPTSMPWNSTSMWHMQTLDGRLFLTVKPDTSAAPIFVCVNAAFTAASSVALPNVYPANPLPIPARLRCDRLVFPEFLARKIDSSITWLRFQGDADTDGDGIADFAETGTGVFISMTNTGSSPTVGDTDGDGLSDLEEVTRHGSNPSLKDTDGDGFTDGFEVTSGFSPTSTTSKPAVHMEAVTAVELKIATKMGVRYRIETSPDLQTWSDSGIRVDGTGGEVRDIFSRADQRAKYWRAVEESP